MINSIVSQGLIWAILGLGIFMTFRILDFPDMTTEGSFPAWRSGGGDLDYQRGQSTDCDAGCYWCRVLGRTCDGSSLHKGRIPTLLSGILVMTSCNSVILFVMQRANLGLWAIKNSGFLPFASGFNEILIGLIFVTLVILGLIFFLDTRLGQAYIATGDNPDMAKSFGINTDRMELMGLVISNGIIALSGALMAQQEGYADASRGIGVIVIGLASLIIGEVLFSNVTLTERLLSIAIGSIAYQFLIWAVIALGINTSYIRIFSALILAICLMIPTFKGKS